MVRAQLGPFADVLVRGRRAVPLALERAGFRFRRVDLPAALAAALDDRVRPPRPL
jgi:NAD dependent epimerase/dehydratase family enzyme